MENCNRIDLKNWMFDAMLGDLNMNIENAFTMMEAHSVESATITLKLSFEVEEQTAGLRTVRMPKISHKIVTKLGIKDETAGQVGAGFELIKDEVGNICMVPIDDGQTVMDIGGGDDD